MKKKLFGRLSLLLLIPLVLVSCFDVTNPENVDRLSPIEVNYTSQYTLTDFDTITTFEHSWDQANGVNDGGTTGISIVDESSNFLSWEVVIEQIDTWNALNITGPGAWNSESPLDIGTNGEYFSVRMKWETGGDYQLTPIDITLYQQFNNDSGDKTAYAEFLDIEPSINWKTYVFPITVLNELDGVNLIYINYNDTPGRAKVYFDKFEIGTVNERL